MESSKIAEAFVQAFSLHCSEAVMWVKARSLRRAKEGTSKVPPFALAKCGKACSETHALYVSGF